MYVSRYEEARRTGRAQRAEGRERALLEAVALVAVALFLLLVPPILFCGSAIALAVYARILKEDRKLHRTRNPAATFAVLYVFAAVAATLNYFAAPQLLPMIRVSGAKAVHGVLVVDTGSTYYVRTGVNEITAIDHARVQNAVVTSRRSPHWPTTLDYIKRLWR
jgi:hypothetical protein